MQRRNNNDIGGLLTVFQVFKYLEIFSYGVIRVYKWLSKDKNWGLISIEFSHNGLNDLFVIHDHCSELVNYFVFHSKVFALLLFKLG